MKELAVLLVVAAAVAAEGPYAPSGWKPDGPAFELPSGPNLQPPQNPFLPVDPRTLSIIPPDAEDVTVQGLPVTEVTRDFSPSPVSGLQYDGVSINAALQSLNEDLHDVQFQRQVERFNDLEKQRYEFSFTPLQSEHPGMNQDKLNNSTTKTQELTTKPNTGKDILNVNRPSLSKRDGVEVEVTKQRLETYPPEAFLAPLTQVSFLSNPGEIFRVPITQQVNQNVLPAHYASLAQLPVDPKVSQLQQRFVFQDKENLHSKGFLVPGVPEQRTGFIITREPAYSQYQQQTPVFVEPLTIQPTNEAVPITQAQPELTMEPELNHHHDQSNNENVQAKNNKQKPTQNKPEKIKQQPSQPTIQSQEDQTHEQAKIIHAQQLQELQRQVEQYKEAQNIRAQLIQVQLQQAQLNQAQQILQQQNQNEIPLQSIPLSAAQVHQAPLEQTPGNQIGYQVQINHGTPQLLLAQPIQSKAPSDQATLKQMHINSGNQIAHRNHAAMYQEQLNQYHISKGNKQQFDRIQQAQLDQARQDALNEQGQQKQIELYLQQLNNAQLEQIKQAEGLHAQRVQARLNQKQHQARLNQHNNMAQRNRQAQINKGRPHQSQTILMKLGPRPTHQKNRNKENLSDESSRERVNSKTTKHAPGSSQNSANQPEEIEFHLQQPSRLMLPLQPQYFQDDSGPPQPVFYRVQDSRAPHQPEVAYQRQKHEPSRESFPNNFQHMAKHQPQLLQGEVLYNPYPVRDTKVLNVQPQFFSNRPLDPEAVFYLSRQDASSVANGGRVNVNQDGMRIDTNGSGNDGSVAVATATAFGARTRPRVMSNQYGPPQGAVLAPSTENSKIQSLENSKEIEPSLSKMTTRRKHSRMRSTRVRPLYVVDDTGHFVMA